MACALYAAAECQLPDTIDRLEARRVLRVDVQLAYEPDVDDHNAALTPALRIVELRPPLENPKGILP